MQSGKMPQIDYALTAVAAGKTSLGIKGLGEAILNPKFNHLTVAAATDGVVIATERKVQSILVDPKSLEKIAMLT